MFKNLTVGSRIAIGFVLLLLVTMALGGIGAWNMVELAQESSQVSKVFLPQVKLFNHIERKSLEVMAWEQAFILSGDEGHRLRGQEAVAQLKKLIAQARDAAARAAALGKMRSSIDRAARAVKQFEDSAEKMRKIKSDLTRIRRTIDQDGANILRATDHYLAIQERLLRAATKGQGGRQASLSRLDKLGSAKRVLLRGNRLNSLILKSELQQDTKLLDQAQADLLAIRKLVQRLRVETSDPEAVKALDQVEEVSRNFLANTKRLAAIWAESKRLELEQSRLAKAVVAAAQANLTSALKEVEAISGETKSMELMMFIGLGVALLLGLVLAWTITRSITKPLAQIITGLRDGSQQVAAASDQVSTSSQQLAGGASQQAASLEETSASLEEITSMTRANADNAGQADNLMSEVKRAVEEADRDMNEMATSLDRIAKLGDETGKIVKAIDEIAFQTNLLALNAAVEAARAGEAGAGFAVVADEVRNLAMRAAEAAKGTQGLIEEMVSGIEQSSQMMGRTLGGFEQVAQAANKVAELVSEIAVASGEQAQGVDQINLAVSELDRVTQSNAANAEEGAAAAEEMNAMAMSTHDLVDALSAMVGGAGGNGRPPADRETRMLAKKMIPFKHGNKESADNGSGPDPEAVIPLEESGGDRDFVDF